MGECPIPGAWGVLRPEGSGANGVMILGEAMGEQEAKDSLPFRPSGDAGSVLERAIRRIGTDREQYVLWNVLPTHPPGNNINAPWLPAAIEWGRSYFEEQLDRYKPRAILALGNTAVRAATGLCGRHLGVTHLTGYVLPGLKPSYPPVVACFHPAFLRRGKMSLLSVLMRTLRLAIQVAREQRQPFLPPTDNPPPGYILAPTEADALEFARRAEDINPEKGFLAYDLETNYSTNEDEAEEQEVSAADFNTIRSIQFSYAPGSGIFMPWRQPYVDIARRLLATPHPKLSWNGWRFDNPLLRDNECVLGGRNLDLMWAWHHAQPDIPRGLQFAAAMQGQNIYSPTASWPWPWKHLDSLLPAFYGIVDVDVLQWMVSYEG